jgi:hypothetical protein
LLLLQALFGFLFALFGIGYCHFTESAMKQFSPKAVALAALIAVISVRSGSQTKLNLNAFFKQNIGLSQERIADVNSGKPVALALKSRIPDEIFIFGTVYIDSDPEKYVRFSSDIDRLRKIPEYLAIGKFSEPPQIQDLKGFDLDGEDIEALKECKPGDCMIQMPASRMKEFQKAINWAAPNAVQQANQLLKKSALQSLLAYRKGGNQVLDHYNDRDDPTDVAGHFKYMMSYSKALPTYLPDFYNYLLTYPNKKPANVTDSFQWAKVDFGLKPTLRIVHIVTMRGSTPGEPAYVIAEKQLYSSHYFETALDLTFCIRDSQKPGKSGFYLIKAMGSEQAGLTGLKGAIVRKAAVSRSVSSLENSLAAIKTTLENQK